MNRWVVLAAFALGGCHLPPPHHVTGYVPCDGTPMSCCPTQHCGFKEIDSYAVCLPGGEDPFSPPAPPNDSPR